MHPGELFVFAGASVSQPAALPAFRVEVLFPNGAELAASGSGTGDGG